MPFSIQTKYAEQGTWKQGDVVAIRSEGFEYSEGDCLSKWMAAGRNPLDFPKTFAVTYISNPDMTGDEPEVQKLLELYSDDPNAPHKRRLYLDIPADYHDPNRVELRETGETVAEWSVIQDLIRVR